ncbi:hypothetical protein GWI33_002424 [Rhynchophorus ferrugineus]|uniref:Uncharacterized protein n=1 Tax=Rhynchophorus ferrugineus TaxID=354439 RepID=A0A834MLI0_RHYFE|nr:hypothetical protein GWI33_002424 [Rhynchophorus ferrugineus]
MEERLLQDRILRILGPSTPSDVLFLYFNNNFPDQPPSCSLFEDDLYDDESSVQNHDGHQTKGCHNMFPQLVTSRIIDNTVGSVYIEDIITRVYMPSEEFAQIETINSEHIWYKFWRWLKGKIICN